MHTCTNLPLSTLLMLSWHLDLLLASWIRPALMTAHPRVRTHLTRTRLTEL